MRPSTATSPAPTRRARQRAAAIGEIKALARRQLAEQGPGALSLRAIAREMGTASSALYRYFPSQGDLVTALCVEAYDSLARALTAARAPSGPPVPAPAGAVTGRPALAAARHPLPSPAGHPQPRPCPECPPAAA